MQDIFFKNLYKFVYVSGTYLKPHVTIMNGILMGGGAGISLPGMFRVVTEKTVFASPEVQIGFHPDVGASYYLSRLPGYLGEYLALTGEKLKKLPCIEERLCKLLTDDRSVIENSLAQYGTLVYPDERSLLHCFETVGKYFCHDTVEEIVEAVENRLAGFYDEWPSTALGKIKEACPLSLKVTLRSGVRARLVDKDFTPKWDPFKLEEVTVDTVEYFLFSR